MLGQLILLHLLVCIVYALHWGTYKPNKFKITKFFHSLLSFNSTRILILFLRFWCLELRNIYKQILNRKRIPNIRAVCSYIVGEFVYRCSVGAKYPMLLMMLSVQQKQLYNCKAEDVYVKLRMVDWLVVFTVLFRNYSTSSRSK